MVQAQKWRKISLLDFRLPSFRAFMINILKKCFDVFGADKIMFRLLCFDVDAEWNGRWFNSIRAWKACGCPGAWPFLLRRSPF